ncbi:SEC23-interacting protein isoform 2 [Schistosoma japonicum]|uniref:SEC23-interacting protein isoform 2 n=1 Tax=Schistosoma japonicum TaxID=6182 RepID=A0A4Z2DXB7_SCHJA|nr:SEC23-interacting protein isoform 2 [Schistosoma japonicum]
MIQYLAWPYDLTSTNRENVVAGTSSPFIELDSSQLSQEMSLTGQLFEGRVCYVQRGLNEQLMEQIDEGDYQPVDQLFFIVHGIGSIYNLKGQGLIDCVNDMRRIAKRLSQTHFSHHPYRVEFLPILWHDELHSDTVTGLDKQLEQITLGSIPKLRQFTNDSLMDILFYTSSKYSQIIVNTVAREIKRLRELFLSRNPNFSGNISIIGHSLGAVISFDLLCHQTASSSSCATTVDQSLILLSSTICNNSSNNISGIYVQSKTTSDLDHVDELPGELMTCQSTNDVYFSTTTTVTTTPAATITTSCTKDSTSIATSTSISENISPLSSTISSYASSSTCPPNDRANDESKSEHNSSNTSDAGQNDMGEWSIVDFCNHDNQRNHNRSKCSSNNNKSNTNKRQSDPVFRLSLNNISQLNQILLQNGLSVDQTRSILQSIIDLNKINQMKSDSPEDFMKEVNNVEDVNSSTITSNMNPDRFPNIVTTTTNSTLTSFWLENYCFCSNKCSNNNSTSNSDFVSAGFGITLPNYPQLGFTISGLYTLGSPIPLFLTARGIKTLSREFHLPTCSTFYNIFHPFDPVAYRMETLIDSEFQKKSVLIPHHKGRKRIHLQLKDNLSWVGSELKSKLYSSVQSTWRSLHDFALAHKFISTSDEPVPASAAYGSGNSYGDELESYQNANNFTDNRNDVVTTTYRNIITQDLSFNSQLNQGRRIDYVLQEAALESFNEYLFALTSHATYWDSVDTVLFILTEAYSEQGILPSMSGQKNIPQCTIHARALSPPLIPTVGSSSIQPLLNPSLPADLIANVSTDQVPSSQQSDRSVSLNLFNQSQTSDVTTNIAGNIVSSFTKTTTIPVHLQFPSCVSPSIIPTTINNNFIQTVTSSCNQMPVSSYYSSAGLPSSHVLSNSSTQKYVSSQALTCMSQDSDSNPIQTQQSHYSSIPVYTHRKETSLTNSAVNPTSNFLSPSFVQYYPRIITTTSGIVSHSVPLMPVLQSVGPDSLNTPASTFTSTEALQDPFYPTFQASPPPVSQQQPPPSYIHYN